MSLPEAIFQNSVRALALGYLPLAPNHVLFLIHLYILSLNYARRGAEAEGQNNDPFARVISMGSVKSWWRKSMQIKGKSAT